MKKLMIVAFAATLVGVTEAVPLPPTAGVLYDATFTLKTTVGKDTKQTKTYNLGKSTGNVFWYEDASLTNYIDATDMSNVKILDTKKFMYKTVKKQKVPVPTKEGLEDYTLYTNLVALADSGTYDQKSAGVYCYTFKGTDPVCYRVAGTIKYSGFFNDDECLNTLTSAGANANSLDAVFVDAFGAAEGIDWTTFKVKSNKVELYTDDATGMLPLLKVDKTLGWVAADCLDNNKGDRTFTALSIAGHGTFGYVYDDTNEKVDWPGVTSVSGNVVGTANPPVCVTCCTPDIPTDTFNCCSYGLGLNTAVFGTFTIKYNNTLTKKELY